MITRFALALLSSGIVVACQTTRSAQSISVNPYRWPPFVACCFYTQGIVIEPRRPFAEREQQESANWHLRFGKVYFVLNDEAYNSSTRSVQCIYGRDTMTVYVQTEPSRNVLYDSIPFQAGRYFLSLNEPASKSHRPAHLNMLPVSFASYFLQHEADLQQHNPFVGTRFRYKKNTRGNVPIGYIPPAPTYIFQRLLQHTVYEPRNGYAFLPLAKGEPAP